MARQSMWNTRMYYEGRSQERKTKAHALAVEALRVAPDLPEAHIALGHLDLADSLLQRLDRRNEVAPRPSLAATGARCRAMLAAARGEVQEALEVAQKKAELAKRAELDRRKADAPAGNPEAEAPPAWRTLSP